MDRLVMTAKDRYWHPDVYQRDQWVKREAAKLFPGSKVLDAGAGASKYRPFFAHCEYKTQDFCAYNGPLVKYLEPIDYICDVADIPLPDGALDAILCTEVIEHVVDPMVVLAEFKRLLKPGGKLLLSAPLLSALHMQPYHYYGGFTHYWYEHWLPRRGFKVETITRVGGPARAAVVFAQCFYMIWAAQEKKSTGLKRLLSMGARAPAKLIVHYVLPWLLPPFDRWLGPDIVCNSYLVTAIREG